MSHLDTIRAWKDEEYRLSLSSAERAQLPAHPAGLIELTEADLGNIGGGWWGSGYSDGGWYHWLIHCYEDYDKQQSVCDYYEIP